MSPPESAQRRESSTQSEVADLVAQSVELLARLVGFDTTSSVSNLPLIEWVEDWCAAQGLGAQRINEKAGKASLVASIGPQVAGGIVLAGHTDVVPTAQQEWDTDPYTLTEKGTRLYGRGTSDMKAFLAVALVMARRWGAMNLARPAYVCLTHDEEIGCLSAADMGAFLAGHVNSPALVVVGEPTEMRVVNAHKGIWSFETIVEGLEAHSSNTHKGVNAVMVMGDLIHWLNQKARQCREGGTLNARFEPPYTTVHVGVVQGGVVRNIIPRYCRIAWEIRPLPEDDPQVILDAFRAYCAQLEQEMRRVSPASSIRTNTLTRVFSASPEATRGQETLMMRLAGSNSLHAVSFGTEAGFYQQAGLPALVCGPGSIDQAHIANEFIAREQIERCVAFMLELEAEVLR